MISLFSLVDNLINYEIFQFVERKVGLKLRRDNGEVYYFNIITV